MSDTNPKSKIQNPKSPLSYPSCLSEVQRWMQAVITHPDGVLAGTQSDAARQHLEVAPEDLQAVIARSRNQTSEERLAIYHNAYFARLLECLRNIYPMVAKTLGEEAFDALAVGYLQSYPSHSYTLDRLGDRFASYLAETRPDLDRAGQPTETWPDFMIDLARLEWNIGEVFDGPGVEGQATLSAEQLLAIDADRWPAVRLMPAPCLRLLSFEFQVNDYFTALRQSGDDADPPPLPQPEGSWLALWRRDFVVRRHALDREQYELLTALMSAQPIGVAIEQFAATAITNLDELAGRLQSWFRTWTAAGFFVALAEA
jgi:hypothetical protein